MRRLLRRIARILKLLFLLFKLLLLLAVVLGILFLACQAYLPSAMQKVIVAQLSKTPGVDARVGPIALSLQGGELDLSQFAISLTEGDESVDVLGWQRLRVAVMPLSVLGGLVRVRHVIIDGPVCRLDYGADGSINLTKLVSPSAEEPEEPAEDSPSKKGIAISEVKIRGGQIVFVDRTVLAEGVKTDLDELKVDAKVHYNLFEAGGAACAFKIEGRILTDQVGKLTADGFIDIQEGDLRLDAQFEIENISLKHLDPYCQQAPVRLTGGTANVTGRVRCRKGKIESHIEVVLDNVEVAGREGVVTQVALGMPTQAIVGVLSIVSGELPLLVDLEGDMTKPDFNITKTVMDSIGRALTSRAGSLGKMGVAVASLGVDVTKMAVGTAVSLGTTAGGSAVKVVTGVGGVALDAMGNPIASTGKLAGSAVGAVQGAGAAATRVTGATVGKMADTTNMLTGGALKGAAGVGGETVGKMAGATKKLTGGMFKGAANAVGKGLGSATIGKMSGAAKKLTGGGSEEAADIPGTSADAVPEGEAQDATEKPGENSDEVASPDDAQEANPPSEEPKDPEDKPDQPPGRGVLGSVGAGVKGTVSGIGKGVRWLIPFGKGKKEKAGEGAAGHKEQPPLREPPQRSSEASASPQ